MNRTATIILNRNLPEVTDNLCEHIKFYDKDNTDTFVVEAGSDKENLSNNTTWYVNSPLVMKKGLRYSRGMNFGLSQLQKEDKFSNYDFFFLLSNDTILEKDNTVAKLTSLMDEHPRVGILSPCSQRWGEKFLFKEANVKYFWFIHNNAYFLRRDFIDSIKNNCDEQKFLFDGTNFRGYGSESEIIAKAYANYWSAAITTEVWAEENESYLIDSADQIKTESFKENIELYVREGKKWMRDKYGFNSHWSMQQYVRSFYDKFFECYPEYMKYKI